MSIPTETTSTGAATAAGSDPGTGERGDPFDAVRQAACDELAELVGRAQACRASGVPRSSEPVIFPV